MKTTTPFATINTPQPSLFCSPRPLDKFRTCPQAKNSPPEPTQNNSDTVNLVTSPTAVLDRFVKASQKEMSIAPKNQNPVKATKIQQGLLPKTVISSPSTNASIAELASLRDFHSPTSGQKTSTSWQNNILKTKAKPQTPSNTAKPERFSHKTPKTTTNADHERTSFNSIKINLPPFPYPKMQTQESGNNLRHLEEDRTCPSTEGSSLPDVSSPNSLKCNFSWNDAGSWYSNRAKRASCHAEVGSSRRDFRASDFEVIRELGRGKYGVVKMVRHRRTGFLCALKTLRKSLLVEENVVGQLVREIKIQSTLDHPNIIKLYGFFHDSENVYLVMELSTEGQLYEILKAQKRLEERKAATILKQLCEAIQHMQTLKIMHRDIKPENVVIVKGAVKLCDFGWAVCRGNTLRSTFCGTPLYVSPEVLKGELYDEKSDLWSLGILAYEMMVGQLPFKIERSSELRKIIEDEVEFPTNIAISGLAKDFVLRILKKSPGDRLEIAGLLRHPFLQQSESDAEL